MEQFFEFAFKNWALFAGLIVVTGMLFWPMIGGRFKKYLSANPQEAVSLINQQDAIVIDIRSDNDFSEGHILSALHIPQDQVESNLPKLTKHQKKPVIVYCKSGTRSQQICKLLTKEGFDSVYNLQGGILAWQGASLPTTQQ